MGTIFLALLVLAIGLCLCSALGEELSGEDPVESIELPPDFLPEERQTEEPGEDPEGGGEPAPSEEPADGFKVSEMAVPEGIEKDVWEDLVGKVGKHYQGAFTKARQRDTETARTARDETETKIAELKGMLEEQRQRPAAPGGTGPPELTKEQRTVLEDLTPLLPHSPQLQRMAGALLKQQEQLDELMTQLTAKDLTPGERLKVQQLVAHGYSRAVAADAVSAARLRTRVADLEKEKAARAKKKPTPKGGEPPRGRRRAAAPKGVEDLSDKELEAQIAAASEGIEGE